MRFDTDFGSYLLGARRGRPASASCNRIRSTSSTRSSAGGTSPGGSIFSSGGRSTSIWSTSIPSTAPTWLCPLRGCWASRPSRGPRCAATCRCRRRSTSWTAPAPARKIRPPGRTRPASWPAGGRAHRARRAAPLTARLAYRRMWSATADRLPGEPRLGINDEKRVADGGRGLAAARLRHGRNPIQPAARRVRRSAAGAARPALAAAVAGGGAGLSGADLRRRFDLEHLLDRRVPRFRATYEVALAPGVRANARGFVRFFGEHAEGETVGGQDLGAEAPGGRTAGGGRLGGARRRAACWSAPTVTTRTATAAARRAAISRGAVQGAPAVGARGAPDRLRVALRPPAARTTAA